MTNPPQLRCKRIGAPLLFGRLWQDTGCRDVIQDLLAARHFEFPVEQAVFVSVLHRIMVSGSDRACEKWMADYDIAGVDALAVVAAQNHRLNERLLTLQSEERADLARDLHDEIGPLLFAVDMTAAAIEHLPGNGCEHEVRVHAQAIHDAVGRMQRHIRAILGRLRPLEAIGLAAAIDRLAGFWRGRRADIVVTATVSVEEDRIGSHLRETIYRVVQEGMSNSIRHGAPRRVVISVTHDAADMVRVEVTDDGIGMAPAGATARCAKHLGLVGMRERVMAMAGSLAVGPGPVNAD